jgi:hypothetical protein
MDELISLDKNHRSFLQHDENGLGRNEEADHDKK